MCGLPPSMEEDIVASSEDTNCFATWVYGNARGLRQGSCDFRRTVAIKRPTFFAVCETHLKGDPVKPLIPWGYEVLCRLDRSKHGGGLLLGAKKHILADKLKMDKYNSPGNVEMVGIEWAGVHWILCYTPDSRCAVDLLEAAQQYKEGHAGKQCVFMGDFNCHNNGWIVSESRTDTAGLQAQEFCELFGLRQIVDFTTRGGNTLDLVMSELDGVTTVAPGFGNSDHKSMFIMFRCNTAPPVTPVKHSVLNWRTAPWQHIKGATKRGFKGWQPSGTVDDAEAELNDMLTEIIRRYVKEKVPSKPGPTPWWNSRCEKAYQWKHKCFLSRQVVTTAMMRWT